MSDEKLYFSKLGNPESWPDDVFVQTYEPCDCGLTLEDALLLLGGTTLVHLSVAGGQFKQKVICNNCAMERWA